MQTRKVLLGLTCFAASATLVASPALADRRTGLAGNLLIQDPDDLFPFPQYALAYRNMFRLDYGPDVNPLSGNGVLTLGNAEQAFGVALHRGDLLSPDIVGFNQELAWLQGVGDPLSDTAFGTFTGPVSGEAVVPATVFDLFFARAMGDNALGARLGFGRGIESVTPEAGETQKAAQTFFAAQLGYSMLPPEGFRLDLSGNIVAAFGKETDVDGDDVDQGHDLRAGLLGRGYYPINDLVDVGMLAQASINNERRRSGGTTSNDFNFGAMAGVGPAIHLDRAKVAAYTGFTLGYGKNAPDTDDESADESALQWAAPMVNMAAEVQVLDWLFVRTGAQYTWDLDWEKTDAEKSRQSGAPFVWSAGIGMTKNNFYFDGVVQNAFVTNGPAFIGGDGGANGLFFMASASYMFGDVFDAGPAAPAEPPAAVSPRSSPVLPEPPAPEPATTGETGAADATVDASGEAQAGEGAVNARGEASAGFSLED